MFWSLSHGSVSDPKSLSELLVLGYMGMLVGLPPDGRSAFPKGHFVASFSY